MSLATKITFLVVIFSFVLWWLSPHRQGKKTARLVEKYCPKELLEFLLLYREPNGKLSAKFTDEIRQQLSRQFSPEKVDYAIQAVEYGKAEIYLSEEGMEDHFLYAAFDGAVFSHATFVPIIRGGKTGL